MSRGIIIFGVIAIASAACLGYLAGLQRQNLASTQDVATPPTPTSNKHISDTLSARHTSEDVYEGLAGASPVAHDTLEQETNDSETEAASSLVGDDPESLSESSASNDNSTSTSTHDFEDDPVRAQFDVELEKIRGDPFFAALLDAAWRSIDREKQIDIAQQLREDYTLLDAAMDQLFERRANGDLAMRRDLILAAVELLDPEAREEIAPKLDIDAFIEHHLITNRRNQRAAVDVPRAGLAFWEAMSQGKGAGAIVDMDDIVAASYLGLKRYEELVLANDDLGIERMRRSRKILYPGDYRGRARIIRVLPDGMMRYAELRLLDDPDLAGVTVWASAMGPVNQR